MATLAFSALGAFVGNAAGIGISSLGLTGTAIGWTIGGLIGNSFQKLPNQEGPRLKDLKPTQAAYGASINTPYGTDRLDGVLIWQADLIEIANSQSVGGKGGPSQSVTNYEYFADFAVMLGKGEIAGISKIWADSVLIYDRSSATTADAIIQSKTRYTNMSMYLGTETQTPDSLIESYEGVDSVPAHRGYHYLVFNELALAEFGNRIPNITAEVFTSGTFDQTSGLRVYASGLDNLVGGSLNYEDGLIKQGVWDGPSNTFIESKYDLDHNMVSKVTYPHTGSIIVPGAGNGSWPCVNNHNYYARYTGSGTNRTELYYRDKEVTFGLTTTLLSNGGFAYWKVGATEFLFAASVSNASICRWQIDSSDNFIKSLTPDAEYVYPGGGFSNSGFIQVFENHLYVHWTNTLGTNNKILKFDENLTLIDEWPGISLSLFYSGQTALTRHPLNNELLMIHNSSNGTYSIERLNDDGTLDSLTGLSSQTNFGAIPLDKGLVASKDRTYTVVGPMSASAVQLSTIVSDICSNASIDSVDLDVTSLTDSVTGYTIDRPLAGRGAIEPLRQAYLFDMVESDGKLKAVKRGQSSVATISSNDLGVRSYGSSKPDDVTIVRQEEYSLPKSITIRYKSQDADYQPLTQRSQRLVTNSVSEVNLELPIVYDNDNEPARTAETLLFTTWHERNSYEFQLPLDYIDIDPGDVITLPVNGASQTIRVTSVDYDNGYLSCKGVRDESSWSSSITGGASSITKASTGISGVTVLGLLDINLLRSRDDQPGFYIAGFGYYSGWLGANVYQSSNDSTYSQISSVTNPATFGYTTDALSTGDSRIIDTVNTVTVRLSNYNGSLSSITKDQMLTSTSNAALIGDEIIQFQTATDNGDGSYTLSNLIRALNGTEQTGHASGDRFILLESTTIVRVNQSASELNSSYYYKGVTFGGYLQGATSQQFTNTGNCLKPWSAHDVRGSRDGSNNLTITWYRRDRIRAQNFWTPTVSETSESYEIDVMSGGSPEVARTISVSTPSASYTAAQQITDGFTPGDPITVRVYQLSATVGRGYVKEVTI